MKETTEEEKRKTAWKNAELLPRYTVGQLANILDVHPQSLRYFDEIKLTNPTRVGTDRKRIYSNRDIFEIIEHFKYKNLGFTIKEIKQILKEDSLEEINRCMTESLERLHMEEKRLQLLQNGIMQTKETVEKINILNGKYTYQRRPVMYLHLHHINGVYSDTPGSVQARKLFMEFMPASFYLFEFSDNQPTDEYRWNIAMEAYAAKQTGFCNLPEIVKIDSADCIYTIFSLKGGDGINRACYEPALDFIRQNGWIVNGNIYGKFITAIEEDNELKRYFEVWIPISK